MERVNSSGPELACGNSLLEEDVQLAICATLRLGKTEERPYHTQKAESSPKETSFPTPVPSRGVQHIWDNDAVDDAE